MGYSAAEPHTSRAGAEWGRLQPGAGIQELVVRQD